MPVHPEDSLEEIGALSPTGTRGRPEKVENKSKK